eukprot:4802419-Amphidinium_carterae.2
MRKHSRFEFDIGVHEVRSLEGTSAWGFGLGFGPCVVGGRPVGRTCEVPVFLPKDWPRCLELRAMRTIPGVRLLPIGVHLLPTFSGLLHNDRKAWVGNKLGKE